MVLVLVLVIYMCERGVSRSRFTQTQLRHVFSPLLLEAIQFLNGNRSAKTVSKLIKLKIYIVEFLQSLQ